MQRAQHGDDRLAAPRHSRTGSAMDRASTTFRVPINTSSQMPTNTRSVKVASSTSSTDARPSHVTPGNSEDTGASGKSDSAMAGNTTMDRREERRQPHIAR
ncbi:unnamed protein product [Prorocentrum cordatum]|uniref:Uncharacterized protein n=1 Tax=Prorocentrum cordatum TaxID=2364126 RepID=A0ABN9SLC2_9DINO|nr:unnamed protein product [Polarella glacialis]